MRSQLWIKTTWCHQLHSGFLDEWRAHASGLVSALESFQRVSVSSWEPASSIVFVRNETTLKPMPLPCLWWLWGTSGTSQCWVWLLTFLVGFKKQIHRIYDNVSWYTRCFLKAAADLNDAQLKVACFARVLHWQHSGVHGDLNRSFLFTELTCDPTPGCSFSFDQSRPQFIRMGTSVDILRMFHKRTRGQTSNRKL